MLTDLNRGPVFRRWLEYWTNWEQYNYWPFQDQICICHAGAAHVFISLSWVSPSCNITSLSICKNFNRWGVKWRDFRAWWISALVSIVSLFIFTFTNSFFCLSLSLSLFFATIGTHTIELIFNPSPSLTWRVWSYPAVVDISNSSRWYCRLGLRFEYRLGLASHLVK